MLSVETLHGSMVWCVGFWTRIKSRWSSSGTTLWSITRATPATSWSTSWRSCAASSSSRRRANFRFLAFVFASTTLISSIVPNSTCCVRSGTATFQNLAAFVRNRYRIRCCSRLPQAVRKKYTASKFYNISTIHHLKSPLVHVYANKTLKDH